MTTDIVKRAKPARNQTIERAALILACFSTEQNHLTLAQLADKLALNQSTVYRYVTTLQRAELLSRDERRGGYSLGLRVIELANVGLNQLEVRKQALEEMDRLRDSLDMLVSLGVLFEGDVLHVAHAVPKEWPRWAMTEGRRAVAHCTSLGKVLLATALQTRCGSSSRSMVGVPTRRTRSRILRSWSRPSRKYASAATGSIGRSAAWVSAASVRPFATTPAP